MNEKSRRILKNLWPIVLIAAAIFAAVFFLEKSSNRRLIFTHENTQNPVDIYVRNRSWDTELGTKTPYRNGDSLEYLLFFDGKNGSLLSLDLSRILSGLDGYELELDGKKAWSSDISAIPGEGKSHIIRITGKIRGDGVEDTAMKIITPIVTEEKKIETPVVEIPKEVIISADSIKIGRATYSSNRNELISMTGTGLANVSSIMIGEKKFLPIHSGDTQIYMVVDKNTFEAGNYFVGLLLSNGKLTPLSSGISFSYSKSPIGIEGINPKAIPAGKESYVVLQWYGMKKVISLQLGNGFVFKTPSFEVVTDEVMIVKIPKDLSAGTYHFNMMDTSGIYPSQTASLTITP